MRPTLAPPQVDAERRPDGSWLLRSRHALPAYPRHLTEQLRHWANRTPQKVFLAERDAEVEGFRQITYDAARTTVDAIAQALLDRGLGPTRPLMILSENSVDHALLALGAMQVGVPVAPISTAYSLVSQDFAKLRTIHGLVAPGLVYASDGARYARAFEALDVPAAQVVTSRQTPPGGIAFEALTGVTPTRAMEARYQAIPPQAIAKILFTSGSTGEPKGVLNTFEMLCSNQAAIATVWPFLRTEPPVVLDWLPWSHTFGANHNFNMVLFHGGTFYVDDGRATPELVTRTVANLREVSPTLYFNVPRGFDLLVPHLERDDALRDAFFKNLSVIFYAAASLSQPTWERLEALSIAARGELVTMLSAWGSTETSPLATTVHFPIRRAGVIGVPAPGTTIKLAPVGEKLELRVRGPNVTPGYLKRPELAPFDEEGFFRMGDGGRLLDESDPAKGVVFDGRIGEDFKLSSGTWVHVGAVRALLVERLAPVAFDVVLAGLDRPELGVLVFVALADARALCTEMPAGTPLEELCKAEPLKEHLRELLESHNALHPATSQRVARVLLMAEPPSIDASEITDKGYINQAAVLRRRAALVERLYRGEGDDVVVLDEA